MARLRIGVLAIMEADFVTGPAKNLIEFAKNCRNSDSAQPVVDLTIAAYLRGGEPETAFIRSVRDAGIRLEVIHEKGRFDRHVPAQIRALVERLNPSIVQTHNVKSHFFLRLSGVWHSQAWLAFHHGYTTTDLKQEAYNLVNRWSLRAPQHLVAVCGPFADQLVAQGVPREKISIQHNSVKPYAEVSPQQARDLAIQLAISPGTPVLVTIGRLSREKGHLDLVRALAHLQRKNKKFHAVFVGEGPERVNIETARAALGLNRQLALVGLQHDVRPYYELADVVVIPSHSEGSPNVLLEAMASQKAIAATRVGGIPEIAVDQETALLVEPRAPEAMAGALERLLENPELRTALGSRAKEVAQVSYSPGAYRQSMTDLYQRILAQRILTQQASLRKADRAA